MAAITFLTRRQLYDLVWSKPMRDLASEFEVSDVGLAKICKRHRIPVPGRGYWAKVQARTAPKRAVFVDVDDGTLNRIAIRSLTARLPPAAREIVHLATAARNEVKQKLTRPPEVVPKADPIDVLHKAIRATAAKLRRAKPSQNGGVRAFGTGLCGVDISAANVERAVHILQSLAAGLEAQGLTPRPMEKFLRVEIGPDAVEFVLKERTRWTAHVPTVQELLAEERRQKRLARGYSSPSTNESFGLWSRAYPEKDLVYTGQLAVQLEGWSEGVRRHWADGKKQTVEARLGDILIGISTLVAVRKAVREEREEASRRWQEQERLRAAERQRFEREEKRATYVESVVDVFDKMEALRRWLANTDPTQQPSHANNYDRMVTWAAQRLRLLEASVSPENLELDLAANQLFPASDVSPATGPIRTSDRSHDEWI